MIDAIKQGLDRLSDLTLDETESLIASSYTAFEVAEQAERAEDMSAYLSAARKFTDHKSTLLAAAPPDEGATEAEGGDAGTETEASDAGGAEGSGEGSTEASESEATTAAASGDDKDAESEPDGDDTSGGTDENAESAETDEPAASDEGASEASDTTSTESPATTASADTSEPPEADPAPAGAEAGDPTTTSEEKTVTASASTDEIVDVPADNQPVATSDLYPTTVLAGADVKGVSAGSPFKNQRQFGEAFVNRINAVRHVRGGGDGERMSVATVAATYPDERTLGDDPKENERKIEKVVGEQALTASGGWCAPLPVRYDIFGLGVTDRPVRDAIPGFNATRGGVRFVSPPVLADLEDAVGLWTSTIDASPGTATKAELKIECADEVDVEADAVTLQLEFGNLMSRAYPELVNRNTQLGMIYHARFAEQNLLSRLTTLSTSVTAATSLGVARDFLESLSKAGSAYRNRHRMRRGTPLRVIAPDWVLDAMRTDFMRGLPGDDNVAYADSQINEFLRRQGIRASFHLDGTFGAQSAGQPLVEYPSTFTYYLFAEGTFLFLDGGTLDLGVVRDSELVGTNDYKTFMETFENVAMIGVESLAVTQSSEVEGAVVGTVEPFQGS